MWKADEAYRMGEIPVKMEDISFISEEWESKINIHVYPEELRDYIILT